MKALLNRLDAQLAMRYSVTASRPTMQPCKHRWGRMVVVMRCGRRGLWLTQALDSIYICNLIEFNRIQFDRLWVRLAALELCICWRSQMRIESELNYFGISAFKRARRADTGKAGAAFVVLRAGLTVDFG